MGHNPFARWGLGDAALHNERVSGKSMYGVRDSIASKVKSEVDLHYQIIEECRRRGWLAIHGRMDMASTVTVGAPDFIILREGGILLVECKTKTGKLSIEQMAFHAWARKLGHTVHVVRSLEEFARL